jgi:hypothetical protein
MYTRELEEYMTQNFIVLYIKYFICTYIIT